MWREVPPPPAPSPPPPHNNPKVHIWMNVVDSSKDFHMFFKEGNHYDTFYNLAEDPLLEDALGRRTGWGRGASNSLV